MIAAMSWTRIPLCLFLATALIATSLADTSCDEKRGEMVFTSKCALCHSIGKNVADAAGPNLFGVTGRVPASRSGFAYSSSMRQLRESWSRTSLDRFLFDPQTMVPGTYMAFTGVKRSADRQSLICYLEVQADR